MMCQCGIRRATQGTGYAAAKARSLAASPGMKSNHLRTGNQAMLRRLGSDTMAGVSPRAALTAPQNAGPDEEPVSAAAPGVDTETQPGQQTASPNPQITGSEDAPVPTDTADCPVTAVFVATLAGPEKVGCQIPAGTHGSSRLTRWRLMGNAPANATIDEQFKAIDDPYNQVGAIQKGTYTTNNGLFDDCYALAAKDPLPPDFVLKVEQNHLLNGKVISKNEITFYADHIHFCSHRRLPGTCDFSARCSL
jgi:hypothetical protein